MHVPFNQKQRSVARTCGNINKLCDLLHVHQLTRFHYMVVAVSRDL